MGMGCAAEAVSQLIEGHYGILEGLLLAELYAQPLATLHSCCLAKLLELFGHVAACKVNTGKVCLSVLETLSMFCPASMWIVAIEVIPNCGHV